ncbi:MAG: serine hydrolase [Candidatus Sumerlaeaceae bacterium]
MPSFSHWLICLLLIASVAIQRVSHAQVAASNGSTATSSLQGKPQIVADPYMERTVSNARAAFLKGKPFNRCDAAVLVHDSKTGIWRRGHVNGENLTYPASAVKLAYLAAAMRWCEQNNKPPTALDRSVRPMIEKSDNVQTGVVVDAITRAPNIADLQTTSDQRYKNWFNARQYTMRFLEREELLNGQVLLHKTYPTNSGSDLAGAEKLARADAGKNTMQPLASAELILRMATGSLQPEATGYMRELLTHDRWGAASATGPGFPPGTTYMNKAGWAYDNANDIAFAELPNGQQLVVAVFTNGLIKPFKDDPSPHDKTILAEFVELLLLELGWISDSDRAYFDTTGGQVDVRGEWRKMDAAGCAPNGVPGAGSTALLKPAGHGSGTITWNLSVPRAGLYEVCVAYPAASDRTAAAMYAVQHADGYTSVAVNQRQVGGRWNRLGDFRFEEGAGRVVLSDGGPGGSTVAAGALRALCWPE